MVRGYLGKNQVRGLFWGANPNGRKFYYGRKDDSPIHHDLLWRATIESENNLVESYRKRPIATELKTAMREHDVFVAYESADAFLASEVHALFRRLGYMTYSVHGEMRTKVGNIGAVASRPLHVKTLKKTETLGQEHLLFDEGIAACNLVAMVCTEEHNPFNSRLLASAFHTAHREGRTILLIANSPNIFNSLIAKDFGFRMFGDMTEYKIDFALDLTGFGEPLTTDSLRESALRKLQHVMDRRLRIPPGGLFKGTFNGLGRPKHMPPAGEGPGGQEEAFFRDEGSFARFNDRDPSPQKLREDNMATLNRVEEMRRREAELHTPSSSVSRQKVDSQGLVDLFEGLAPGEQARFLRCVTPDTGRPPRDTPKGGRRPDSGSIGAFGESRGDGKGGEWRGFADANKPFVETRKVYQGGFLYQVPVTREGSIHALQQGLPPSGANRNILRLNSRGGERPESASVNQTLASLSVNQAPAAATPAPNSAYRRPPSRSERLTFNSVSRTLTSAGGLPETLTRPGRLA